MKPEQFIKQILTDVKVKLTDEFDQNFERKAFFDKKWPATTLHNRKGSILSRTGALRRSIQSNTAGSQITFKSSVPYAQIQNEGGKIQVTKKMKKFFWAMHYKSSNAITYRISNKKVNNTIRNRKLTEEANMWKAMALKPEGSFITIKQRQFIGHHPKVDRLIRSIIHQNIQELSNTIHKNHGNTNT
ncbi:MAG: hypothetical protein ACPGSD_07805 [Flavobacteriales bacterium]